jgi:hypothetical protein
LREGHTLPSIYLRVRETHEHYVVALCDESLLGKTLVKGEVKFSISEKFYGGDLVDFKQCLPHLEKATIVNMVGKDSVESAIDAGYVHEKAVIYIEGHPHAQWVRM